MKVIIIGGVAGGASAAARLRRLDENAEIILCEKGNYISFANCGLPYYIGDKITDKSVLTVQTPQSFHDRFNIDVRINSEVISIDKINKTVLIKTNNSTYVESYDKLIISTGAKPIMPNIEGKDLPNIFTLRNIPDTYKIKDYITKKSPSSALIVGGGFIGIEMAENLHNLGIKVSLAEAGNQILPPIDYDMACIVQNYIRAKGINIYLNNGISKIAQKDQSLNVTLKNISFDVDFIIMAIGVSPDTKIANGVVDQNIRGGIIVNEFMQTSDEDIYAVGDGVQVKDFITMNDTMVPLAGPANKQGRIAADNICGIKTKYYGTQGSSILKIFAMTVACTGTNEKSAIKAGLNYEKSFTLSSNHATYYPDAKDMTIKVIFDKNNTKILGAQIIGFEGVDKRCDVFATAIRANMTAFDLANLELCYAPPFSSAKDPVNMAGYVIENIVTGKVNIFHWHDIKNIINRKDVTLLDVRTPEERRDGYIENFSFITLNQLRKNIHLLDKNKPVYVHCHSGLRSYVACRILSQYGFVCYNLSGGFHLYDQIRKNETKNN